MIRAPASRARAPQSRNASRANASIRSERVPLARPAHSNQGWPTISRTRSRRPLAGSNRRLMKSLAQGGISTARTRRVVVQAVKRRCTRSLRDRRLPQLGRAPALQGRGYRRAPPLEGDERFTLGNGGTFGCGPGGMPASGRPASHFLTRLKNAVPRSFRSSRTLRRVAQDAHDAPLRKQWTL